jgi:hypothetical protein
VKGGIFDASRFCARQKPSVLRKMGEGHGHATKREMRDLFFTRQKSENLMELTQCAMVKSCDLRPQERNQKEEQRTIRKKN